MTYMHHDDILQNIFTALKTLCVLPIHSLTPQPLIFSFFTVSTVLPFLNVR